MDFVLPALLAASSEAVTYFLNLKNISLSVLLVTFVSEFAVLIQPRTLHKRAESISVLLDATLLVTKD